MCYEEGSLSPLLFLQMFSKSLKSPKKGRGKDQVGNRHIVDFIFIIKFVQINSMNNTFVDLIIYMLEFLAFVVFKLLWILFLSVSASS